jgi:YD repeat-containing protein
VRLTPVEGVARDASALSTTTPAWLTMRTPTETAITQILNYVSGQVVTNLAVAKLGADGTVQVKANSTATDVTIDVVGYTTTAVATSSYTYAGDSLRSAKTSPDGTITRYTWDRTASVPLLLVEEIDALGTTNDKTVRYLYGPDGGVLQDITTPSTGSEVPRWYHRDHLGSVRALTDNTGTVLKYGP